MNSCEAMNLILRLYGRGARGVLFFSLFVGNQTLGTKKHSSKTKLMKNEKQTLLQGMFLLNQSYQSNQ